MSNIGYVGDNYRMSDRGDGFSGVSVAQKDWAAGRCDSKTGAPEVRVHYAATNAEHVAATYGSGHWSGAEGSTGG